MKIAFIADNICSSGLGHLNRCLAVAQSLKLNFDISSIFIADDEITIQWLKQRGFNSKKKLNGNWDLVVLDSYLLANHEIALVQSFTNSLVAFDDIGNPPGNIDLIINSGINASKFDYSRFAPKKLLLGPLFHPLRNEFVRISRTKKMSTVLKNILVTLGGTTPVALLKMLLTKLGLLFPNINLHVIIGPALTENESLLTDLFPKINFYYSPSSIVDILENMDLAVTGGGQTLFELAYLGIPAVVVEIAPNQRDNIIGFEELGSIVSVGSFNDDNFIDKFVITCTKILNKSICLTEMSAAGFRLIDGKGAERISSNIIQC